MTSNDAYLVRASGAHAQAVLPPNLPVCSLCGGRGERLVEVDGVQRIARCRCQMVPDRLALFNNARIPARHARASFESFDKDLPDTMPGFVAAYKWVNSFKRGTPQRGLVLHGSVGRGKTHLLVSMLRELKTRPNTSLTHPGMFVYRPGALQYQVFWLVTCVFG